MKLARRIKPFGAEMQIEALGRRPERRLAREAEARLDAEDRFAEREFLHGELLDDHLDRQFGQDRLRSRRVRRRLRGFGTEPGAAGTAYGRS